MRCLPLLGLPAEDLLHLSQTSGFDTELRPTRLPRVAQAFPPHDASK